MLTLRPPVEEKPKPLFGVSEVVVGPKPEPPLSAPPSEARPEPPSAPPPAPPAPPAPAANYGASEDTSYRRYRPPRYPPQAVRQRQEGEVVLRVLVGIDGSPAQIEIEKSSRSRLLDRAAMDAVREWKFNPGMRDGKAIQSWVLVPISFKLSDL